jgi:hypothetical protein
MPVVTRDFHMLDHVWGTLVLLFRFDVARQLLVGVRDAEAQSGGWKT